MTRHLVLAALVAAALTSRAAADGSWIFRPSYYSHEPATGQRVNQFTAEKAPYVRVDPTYQQSSYRHIRGGLRVGDSYDYQHIVETWGRGEEIRPYGEWLYPFREGATPFGPWGNPQGPWSLPFSPWFNPYGFGFPMPFMSPWGAVPYRPAP